MTDKMRIELVIGAHALKPRITVTNKPYNQVLRMIRLAFRNNDTEVVSLLTLRQAEALAVILRERVKEAYALQPRLLKSAQRDDLLWHPPKEWDALIHPVHIKTLAEALAVFEEGEGT